VRVVIAYATGKLHPATQAWGELHGAELHELRDVEAQFRLLADLWRDAESFLMVEHDIVPACAEIGLDLEGELVGLCLPERSADGCVVDVLAACPEPWCLHGYPDDFTRAARPGHLCCTRFSRELIVRFPQAIEQSTLEDGHVRGYEHLDARRRRARPPALLAARRSRQRPPAAARRH